MLHTLPTLLCYSDDGAFKQKDSILKNPKYTQKNNN